MTEDRSRMNCLRRRTRPRPSSSKTYESRSRRLARARKRPELTLSLSPAPYALYLPPSTLDHLFFARAAIALSSIEYPASSIQYRDSSLTAFSAAATGGFLALNPGLDDIRSAADSRGDTDGAGRTI